MTTDDLRIEGLKPLIPPAILIEEIPLPYAGQTFVSTARDHVNRIIRGEDERLLVVVGPCSIHDTQAALEYAQKLLPLRKELAADLEIVMRVYFEKPRTRSGWKGLINDPHIDGSFKINEGLRIARKLLTDLTGMGLPVGCEFLDTISPQFIADCVSWGAIGARTTESQVHRELASGLSMAVGFKNGTDGNFKIAIDAIRAARIAHHFLSVTKAGHSAIVCTKGNKDGHVVLRGGKLPNFDEESIESVLLALRAAKLPERVMVDCSHANSHKNYRLQPAVARNLATQMAAGQMGIFGVMIESFLVAGRQDLVAGQPLTYGQSITDACIDLDDTKAMFDLLAEATLKRMAKARAAV